MEFVNPAINIDWVSQSKFMTAVSAALVAASLGLILFVGFNFGIDFAGGTVLQVHVPEGAGDVEEGRVRAAMSELGHPDATIVRLGPASDRAFRINLAISQEEARDLSVEVIDGLSEKLGAKVEVDSVDSIGPRVGQEMRRAGVGAMLLAWVLILIYVWFRFDLRYAPGAVAALVHDVVVTAGVFVVFQWEFDMPTLAALLVVIGYSLNDTIVIYDRIRENLAVRGTTHLEDVVNQSINQTLARTILTSSTTLAVVLAILFLGGPVLRDFAIALTIGIVIGTYSTIYVASALLIYLERRFPPAPAS